MNMLELCDIELGFSAVPLFSGLNLTIAPGEICLLTAPSGQENQVCCAGWPGCDARTARQRTSQLGGRFFLICLLSGAAWPVISTRYYFRI